MCIRDRCASPESYLPEPSALALDEFYADFAHRLSLPVSYTHLDVYKRQGYGHVAAAMWSPAGELIALSRQTVTVCGLSLIHICDKTLQRRIRRWLSDAA